jgi:hypothetical protein
MKKNIRLYKYSEFDDITILDNPQDELLTAIMMDNGGGVDVFEPIKAPPAPPVEMYQEPYTTNSGDVIPAESQTVTVPSETAPKNNTGLYVVIGIIALLMLSGNK